MREFTLETKRSYKQNNVSSSVADIFVVDKVTFSFRFVSWHLLNCHRLWRLSQCNHVNKGKEKPSVFPSHDSYFGMEIKTYFWNAFRFLTFQSSFARLSWLYVRREKKRQCRK